MVVSLCANREVVNMKTYMYTNQSNWVVAQLLSMHDADIATSRNFVLKSGER